MITFNKNKDKNNLLGLYVAAIVLILDQASKFLVKKNLILYKIYTVIPYFLNFVYVKNRGVSFGFLNNNNFYVHLLLIIIGILFCSIFIIYLLTQSRQSKLKQIAIGLILGGALGNLFNHIFLGYVVDFLDFYVINIHFFYCNIADCAITFGVILWALDLLTSHKNQIQIKQ